MAIEQMREQDESIGDLVSSLKTHLAENEGEMSYWGDSISMTEPTLVSVAPSNPAERLNFLKANTIGDCQRCPLSQTRTKIVFGVGNPESKVLFVGEGPGYDEDKIGDPFVGKAGQLLDKILAAIQLDRTKVYIANIVKCHPLVDASQPDKRGNDRPPTPEEIQTCLPFLLEQIALIRPKIIVALGAVAARTLLNRTSGISSLRGQIFEMALIPNQPAVRILPTFHPAALLRDENLKKPVWEDMKKLRTLLHGE